MTTTLTDRLRAAFGASLRQPGLAGPPTSLDRRTPGDPDDEPLEASPDTEPLGQQVLTDDGPYLVREERYSIQQRHGAVALGECLALPPLALGLVAKRLGGPPIDLREAVFLDTETTGLAGGTGTTAFLIGIGFFQGDDEFVVRQLFMRDFPEERAMLRSLAETLTPFRHVVTFNGKSFDLPLLETRFVLARLERRWQPELHLDLLHPARRLWRQRLGSCSLGSLEEAVLGHQRGPDVPSWLIPGIYADFLRWGEVGPLQRVFSHNRHDLLSLASLMTHLGLRLAEPLASDLGAAEVLAVARLYDELGLRERCCELLEAAVELAEGPLRREIEVTLALAHRRAGRRDQAQAIWRRLVGGPSTLLALIEQAKHAEHQQRRPSDALALVEQALSVLELREARDGAQHWRSERAELERRLARLLRKAAAEQREKDQRSR